MKTKHYSKEFRLQAARLVVEQGYSYVEVAQRLGPSAWLSGLFFCFRPAVFTRIILGHRSAAITEVYAELDQQKAIEAIVRVG